MNVGIDFGAHRLKSLRRHGHRLAGRSVRSIYSVVPDTDDYRDVLHKLHALHAVCEGHLAVMGDHAEKLSWLCRIPYASLVPEGRIPDDDPPARQILGALADCLIPAAESDQDVACFTVPGADADRGRNLEFLKRIVRLRGYTPLPLSAGAALVLAEGADNGFTGMGMSFGAESSSLSLVYQGREVASAAVPAGGNWIDQELAARNAGYAWDNDGNCYIDTAEMRRWKESFAGSVQHTKGVREQTLARLYGEVTTGLLTAARRAIERCPWLDGFRYPVPVICGGGSSAIGGFESAMLGALDDHSLAVRTGGVRVVRDSVFTVARGCLIHAELQAESRGERQVA